MTDFCSLSQWDPNLGREPHIRVGIVLPSDEMKTLRLDVPEHPYHVRVERQNVARSAAAKIELSVQGRAVVLRGATGERIGGSVIRLVPIDPGVPQRGSGVRLHDVITGRGFHWQKRVSFSLSGTLEFRTYDGHLLAVNELGLEDYLQGVITAEMSGRCPVEFLKSQCVVARSWVLAHTEQKHTAWPIDRCNDDCCQRYHGTSYLTPRAAEAVTATRGQVVLAADGRIIDANYSKSCGGIMEAPEHVWFASKPGQRAGVDAPAGSTARRFMPVTEANLDEYLTGSWLGETDVFCSPAVVPDQDLPQYLGSVDEGGGHFRWCVDYNRTELEELLRRKLDRAFRKDTVDPSVGAKPVLVADLPPRIPDASVPMLHRLRDIRVLARGPSGRACELEIEYADVSGASRRIVIRSEYRIRECLHEKFLFSSAFKVEIERNSVGEPERIRLVGAGWGHGAGLCQIGALGMAVKGYTCAEILHHYFEGMDLRALY